MVPSSPTGPRSDGPTVPPPFKGGTDGTNPEPDARHDALDLVSAALTAKLAAAVGAPRLASRAARQASAVAAQLVISLSPAVARTPEHAEDEALDCVRCTGVLAALRWRRDEEDDES